MNLFSVYREGAYRHQCGGIFSTLDLAKQAANKFAENDSDDYHEYVVHIYVLDQVLPTGKAFMRDSPPIQEGEPLYKVKKKR